MLPAARKHGVSFVVRSALKAGFLGGEPHDNYGEENMLIPDAKREALATLRAVASRHGVDLVAATLQFNLAPNVASALIVGAARPEYILADHAALRSKIPASFWEELRAEGIIHPDAALPQ